MSELSVELIEKIEMMTAPRTFDIGEKKFSHKKLYEIDPDEKEEDPEEFKAPLLNFWTLTSFVDFIDINLEKMNKEELFIHVKSPEEVVLMSIHEKTEECRQSHIRVSLDKNLSQFPFNQWMCKENFVISTMGHFAMNEDLARIYKYTGYMSNETVYTSRDDGISQEVHLTDGVIIKDAEPIKNPFKLKPYRTFREVDQPESSYNFRVKVTGSEKEKEIKCALFEAEGCRWKLEAVEAVQNWLKERIEDIAIFA